ncbi:MAG TPA: 2Fe-2S iron-sulfur cluster binding domain-containing protein [Chromatiales bacterium]|nr:2Fe-2S iron-sulfur cluster binding domain-containing protein [Chromatiales bacterium]
MGKIKVTDREGGKHELEVENGRSLMEPLRDLPSGGIEALCGGMLSCATCHVFVEPEWYAKFGELEDDEVELLEGTECYKPESSRLSCQIIMDDELDGLTLTIAPEE